MDDHRVHYKELIDLTKAISHCKDLEEVALTTAHGVKTAFNMKGCTIFLLKKGRELGLAASSGLSEEYLNKGPVRYMQEITEAKNQVPIAIYDVQDDPRIQYPEEAQKEGISSLLGVPIVSRNKVVGALRVYTSEPWEFSMEDITIIQAIAQVCGIAMDTCRLVKGYKSSIEALKDLRGKEYYQSKGWTPYEGVPQSVDRSS